MFDLEQTKTASQEWEVNIPHQQKPWNIGLIVGPSGAGKSTIAKKLFGLTSPPVWDPAKACVDNFPDLPIKEIVEILSSVGFSTPPAWLKPYHVLSTGQQFRLNLAYLLASQPPQQTIVYDEYTSVVDRDVAKVASAACSKFIRKRNSKFIAVTCHEDVEPWLNPDWVYRPAEQTFVWRSLRQRPPIKLCIFRTKYQAWEIFKNHHYLSGEIHKSAFCFLATWNQKPVAFSAWLPFFSCGPPAMREHRTVTLPDYQGVGIGNALSTEIASMWNALDKRAISTTTHPAMIRARNKSPFWKCTRLPDLAPQTSDKTKHAKTRLTAGFEYIGKPMNQLAARILLGK